MAKYEDIVAYFRGDDYVWRDTDNNVHFWISEGRDHWSETTWSEDASGIPKANASGVAVPAKVIDGFVMMRFAEILVEGRANSVIDMALDEFQNNFGSTELARIRTKLQSVIRKLEMDLESYR